MSNGSHAFETDLHTSAEAPRTTQDAQTPGPLRGTVILMLQTAFAQRLVSGRTKAFARDGVLGLFGFAERVRTLWIAAAEADPYAEWWLLKIERAVAHAEVELQTLKSTVLTLLSGCEAMTIVPAASIRPVETTLQFTSAQAFRGAQLVGHADAVARAILTARHVGCLTAQSAAQTLWRVGHAVRSAFGAAQGYVATGITREDFANATPRAAFGVQAMGILPSVILNESVTPENLPRRRRGERGPVMNRVTEGLTPREIEPPTREACEVSPSTSTFEEDLSELFSSP